MNDTLAVVRSHLPDKEREAVTRDVTQAIHCVLTQLVDRRMEGRDGLRAEIDAAITRYGRYL